MLRNFIHFFRIDLCKQTSVKLYYYYQCLLVIAEAFFFYYYYIVTKYYYYIYSRSLHRELLLTQCIPYGNYFLQCFVLLIGETFDNNYAVSNLFKGLKLLCTHHICYYGLLLVHLLLFHFAFCVSLKKCHAENFAYCIHVDLQSRKIGICLYSHCDYHLNLKYIEE